MTAVPASVPAVPSDHRQAMLAGFLGWTLDAFDFFLVVMSLTAIGQTFHVSDARVGLSLTLTLAFRPVGAFIFGMLADRYGRRIPLMVDLIFYSVVEVLSGLAPTFTTFLVLRALFGIGMGGEWGVGASLVMEKVPARRRGAFSGLLQQGYAMGYLLAAACYFIVFPRWGWRPLFFIGGVPALLALYVRVKVKESEVWQKTRRSSWRELGSDVVSHWKLFLFLSVFMMGMNLASHGTQDMFPTFLQRGRHLSSQALSGITAFSMVGALIGGALSGMLSDRIGRRRTIMLTLGAGILLIPAWAFAPGLGLLIAGAFFMQFMVQGAWGVIPAHITELVPDAVRGSVPGFAYQCGVLLASTVPWLQARAAVHFGYATTFAVTAALVFAFTGLMAWLGPERRGIVYGEGVA